jgi:hypothetical protein
MHGSRWRREETRPVGPARAARSRRLSPTLQNRVVTNEGPPARQVPYVSRVLNLLDARRGARVADLAMDRGFGSSRTGYR